MRQDGAKGRPAKPFREDEGPFAGLDGLHPIPVGSKASLQAVQRQTGEGFGSSGQAWRIEPRGPPHRRSANVSPDAWGALQGIAGQRQREGQHERAEPPRREYAIQAEPLGDPTQDRPVVRLSLLHGLGISGRIGEYERPELLDQDTDHAGEGDGAQQEVRHPHGDERLPDSAQAAAHQVTSRTRYRAGNEHHTMPRLNRPARRPNEPLNTSQPTPMTMAPVATSTARACRVRKPDRRRNRLAATRMARNGTASPIA